jgi:hypothetical protein
MSKPLKRIWTWEIDNPDKLKAIREAIEKIMADGGKVRVTVMDIKGEE